MLLANKWADSCCGPHEFIGDTDEEQRQGCEIVNALVIPRR